MTASAMLDRLRWCARTMREHYFPIVLGLCAVHAAFGIFLPIYVDELVYKLALGRFFLESGQQLSIFPQCPDTFVTTVSPPLIPGAVMVAGAWQGLSLLGMRASGLVFVALWLGLLWLILGRLTSSRGRAAAFFVIVAFLSFGVTTYALLLSRPDQFLVLALTALVAFPILTRPEDGSATAPGGNRLVLIATMIGYYLVLSLAGFAHPNLVYFTPVVLASIYLTFRPAGLPIVGIVAIVALGLIALGLQQGARVLASCDDPAIRSMAAMRLVDLRGLLSAPLETLRLLMLNALTGFNGLLRNANFGGSYQANWLPPTPLLDGIVGATHSVAVRVVWHVTLVAAILAGLFSLRGATRVAPLLMAATLLLSLAGQAAHSHSLNFTLIELMVPLVVLFCTLTLAPFAERVLDVRWWRPIIVALTTLSISSVFLCLLLITPQLIQNSLSSRLFNDKQHHSYSAWNAATRKATTARLAAACHLRPGQAPDLVIDDVSYASFREDRRPMYATYINPSMMGAALKGRLAQFLVDRRSSGFIGKCNYLPYELQSVAVRDGEACCVGAEALAAAAQAARK